MSNPSRRIIIVNPSQILLDIVPLDAKNRHHLKRLNIAWLEKYFYVEPNDVDQLENPEKTILELGGHVFFAIYQNEIVGTISLMKHSNTCFELGKMAVDEAYQGKGIGKSILNFTLAFSKSNKIQELVLYTNSKLKAAISLYKKAGFKEVEMKETLYKRSNLKMHLRLLEIKENHNKP